MGLLYQLPVEVNSADEQVSIHNGKLTIKSYGLPMVFWGYLLAILTVIFFMFLAIKGPLTKLYYTDDPINKLLSVIVFITITAVPVVLTGFYFYEKVITKINSELTITHRLFWIPFFNKKIELEELVSNHFIDSPNMAKIKNAPEMKGFQNRGYFELYAVEKNSKKKILIDRNSRSLEIKKLKELLESY